MENKIEVETILLNIVKELNKKGEEMFKSLGSLSYVDRCHNHDAKMLIYSLTNEFKNKK